MRWQQGFRPDYATQGRYYAYDCISWPSTIAGALVAIALGAVINLGGIAIGASAFNPFAFERQEDAISVGAALYMMFGQLVALQLGAFVAARSARYPDHFGGALTGVLVWAVSTVFLLVFATLAVGQVAGTEAIAAQAADIAGDVRAGADTSDLGEAEAGADAVATIAWCAAASLAMGLAGAVAGGWLGAQHPAWKDRARIHDAVREP